MFRLFVDSSTGLDVEPEWDISISKSKSEDKDRSRTGRQYRYKWGEFDKISFTVMFVNSEFKSVVNSWWSENVDLLFMEVGGTEVFSVQIANKDQPISSFVKPYQDQFRGKIKLESY